MGKCSRRLFGYNLECTRRVGYGGLYAEMIYNSKLMNEAEGFYPVEFDSLHGFGQSTERLHLLPGKVYEWKIVAGENVKVRILSEYRTMIYSGTGRTGKFSTKYNWPCACVEVVSDSPVRYISLKPADAWHNCRKDVLDVIKELRPGTIRVPGGCYAEQYNWKEGLLPVEDRNPILDGGLDLLFCSHEKYDGHELNIDDYAAICRYVGAEMEYTVRLSDNNPGDAADIVEYCNGSVSTAFGSLRSSRGYREPYNVKTWYIGNEAGLGIPYNVAAEKNDLFAEAMIKVDPTIRTVVSTGNIEEWDDAFLKIAKHIDMCALHYYLVDHAPDWDLSYLLGAADTILYDSLVRASIRASGRKLLFDEWNLRWGCAGDSASALYAASVITMLIRNAEQLNIEGASYFALINEGAIRVYPDHVCLAPDGEVLKRMRLHAGGELRLNEDHTLIKTIHDGFTYVSVYNKSTTEEKKFADLSGYYEILVPNGIWMDISSGEGELKSIPPASVAFIRNGS